MYPQHSRRIMDFRVAVLFVFYSILWRTVHLFNVDTRFPTIYSQPPETYFGYSVLFHFNSQGYSLLVGAPRANQSGVSEIKQPGTIFQCALSGPCNEIVLESKGNQQTRDYYDLKDNGWLGVTMDSNSDGTVVACAHRWKNQKYYQIWKLKPTKDIQDYYSNGLCYTTSRELTPNTAIRHIPLLPVAKQVSNTGIPDYVFGMAGMSSHFTEDKELLLGAPGVYGWDGNLVSIPNNAPQTIWGPRQNHEKKINFMYFGYSITSGHFYGTDMSISHVIGAPRFSYVGKVYIMKRIRQHYVIEDRWEGTQMGEYFGAAVCAADLNNDGYDDLIVGAPLYAINKEEGKVYIFMNKEGNAFMAPLELLGSKIEGARFGMTITAIGDIDRDGYNDFAVGAPYENDRGAVYIFHGDEKTGIAYDLTQVLEAKNIDNNLRGFGISIAKGKDIDRNNFLDMAIGSYESGQAVILRSKPVVILVPWMNISPSKLPINSFPCVYNGKNVGCFNVSTCLWFESPVNLLALKVHINLTVDSIIKGENPRAFLSERGTEISSISKEFELTSRRQMCYNFQAFLRPNIRNYLTPIEVLYEFGLPEEPENNFCQNCPVLSPKSKTSKTQQVYFLKGCRDDEQCESDLHIEASVIDEAKNKVENPQIWAGLNNTVVFNVTITNSGEAAFLTQLNVTIPKWSGFKQLPTSCSEDTTQNDNRFLICDIGNPLPTSGKSSFELHLDLQNSPWTFKNLTIDFNVTTGSVEKPELLQDNGVRITMPSGMRADITVLGSTKEEHILYNNSSTSIIPITHTYKVLNLGPSPLEEVKVDIEIPVISGDNITFINNITIKTKDGSQLATVLQCRGADTLYLKNDGSERDMFKPPDPVKRKKRDISDQQKDSMGFQLFCSNALCRHVECDVQSLSSGESVEIELELQLNTEELDKLKLTADVIDYTTEAKATIMNPSENIQPTHHQPDSKMVITSLDTGHVSQKELPVWVIPVSIVLGILLLFAIAAIFYKLGFFNRSQRDAMKMAKEADQGGFSSQNNLLEEDGAG